MKAGLQLKVSQQLKLNPQLQQSIRMLGLATVELQTEIQQALLENPLLELEDEFDTVDTEQPDENEEVEALDEIDMLDESSLDDELEIDTQWEDVYQDSAPSKSSGQASSDFDPLDFQSERKSLNAHRLEQLHLSSRFDNEEKLIAMIVIENLDLNGFLDLKSEEVVHLIDEKFEEAIYIDAEDVNHVIEKLQRFDPAGVCARSLQESMIIQLDHAHSKHFLYPKIRKLLIRFWSLLEKRDAIKIKRRLSISDDELTEIFTLIQSLNPRPGSQYNDVVTTYIEPDLTVYKSGSSWVIELNQGLLPPIKINQLYADVVKKERNPNLSEQLQSAQWLINSIQTRNATLLRVGEAIVQSQRLFFEYGEEALKPLIMKDIAEPLEIHESTVSRITTEKYIHTPHGIFELKFFFSSHVSTEGGGETSATAVQSRIKKIIEGEDKKKPLSDSKIVDLLADESIVVARRTVAKYRESLGFGSSSARKRLI